MFQKYWLVALELKMKIKFTLMMYFHVSLTVPPEPLTIHHDRSDTRKSITHTVRELNSHLSRVIPTPAYLKRSQSIVLFHSKLSITMCPIGEVLF